MNVNNLPGKLVPVTVIAIMALGLIACSSEPEPELESTAGNDSPQLAPRSQPAEKPADSGLVRTSDNLPTATGGARYTVVPKLEGELEQAGNGLQLMIDGTSEAAYNQSLEWIAEASSKEQYASLESAIRYISIYDARILRNKQRMLEVFDGMTGEQIEALAGEIQKTRSRRSQTE
ncbi:MAG: hypothetical protein ABR550_02115 [Wenzhouxiangellaceae bacterium]